MKIERVGIRPFDLNVSICSKSVPHARRWTEKKSGKTCFYVITALTVLFQQLFVGGGRGNYIEFQSYEKKTNNKQKNSTLHPKQ